MNNFGGNTPCTECTEARGHTKVEALYINQYTKN